MYVQQLNIIFERIGIFLCCFRQNIAIPFAIIIDNVNALAFLPISALKAKFLTKTDLSFFRIVDWDGGGG